MKKLKYLLAVSFCILLCGCQNKNDSIVDNFLKEVMDIKGYHLEGEMRLTNGEENYDYNISVDYKYDEKYKVKLINTNNSHEQVILKNDDGVYVVTPALNKSFSFQSEWPNNSSQSYLLKSIATDIKNTKDIKVEKKNNLYVAKADVNYPNNSSLKSENIYFDKNSKIKKVEVLDKDNNTIITMKFDKIKKNVSISNGTFKLDSIIKKEETKDIGESSESTESSKDTDTDKDEKTKETSVLDNIVYPLYLPENTHLSTKDTVDTDDGDRVIMTYTGGKPFMIVEEKTKPNKEMEVTNIYGEPLLLGSTIGALTENSLEWEANDMSYYISSSYLSGEEMMSIAKSLNTASVVEITNDK